MGGEILNERKCLLFFSSLCNSSHRFMVLAYKIFNQSKLKIYLFDKNILNGKYKRYEAGDKIFKI